MSSRRYKPWLKTATASIFLDPCGSMVSAQKHNRELAEQYSRGTRVTFDPFLRHTS